MCESKKCVNIFTKKNNRAHYILKNFCSGKCPTLTTFLTYISPLIRDTQLKTVAIEVVVSSTSRPLQDTDVFHLEKFLVKHVLNNNTGAMSALLVRMDGSEVLHITLKMYVLTLAQHNYWCYKSSCPILLPFCETGNLSTPPPSWVTVSIPWALPGTPCSLQ